MRASECSPVQGLKQLDPWQTKEAVSDKENMEIIKGKQVNRKTTELRLDNSESGCYCRKTSVRIAPAATCKNLFINKQTGLLQSSVLTTGLPYLFLPRLILRKTTWKCTFLNSLYFWMITQYGKNYRNRTRSLGKK